MATTNDFQDPSNLDIEEYYEEIHIKPCFVKLTKLLVIEEGPEKTSQLNTPSTLKNAQPKGIIKREHVKADCTFCGKMFAKENLNYHVLAHIQEKPYLCKYCDKSFCARENRRRHHQWHSGVRPYECTVCGKHFSCSSNLVAHQRALHQNCGYSCPLCSKTCGFSQNLRRHVKRVHQVELDRMSDVMKLVKRN